MQSGYTGHIVAAEWRWVILVGTTLVLVAFAPFIWITISGSSQYSWQFMGALHGHVDGATYLAKMLHSGEGGWLVHFQHTPEPHNAMFVQIIYTLLGHVARIISVSPIVMFHVARVGAALFMYMAIYQLAASIWMRVRTRRLFFVLASVGAGFGWFLGSLTGDASFPDLTAPGIFPIQSTAVNVHFPLALACLALLASVIITAFRPGPGEGPTLNNGGGMAALTGFALAILYPEVLALVVIALAVYVAIFCLKQRRLLPWAIRWLLVVVLPALPVMILYWAFLTYNPAMAEWNRQNITRAPDPLVFAVGVGIPLILAVPGFYRALRRFEPDGDQFMSIWLVAMAVATYLPTNYQIRFSTGMMIPVAYFASRSLEDFWFRFVNRRWRYRLFVMLLPLMTLSHIIILFAPVSSIMADRSSVRSGLFLERDYLAAFQWLDEHTQPTDAILASPQVSLWLPVWANVRVVYGHPAETLQAMTKKQAVLNWYQAGDKSLCDSLLQGQYAFQGRRYTVRYVLWGPQERALDATEICVSQLRFVASFGSVNILMP